MSIIGIKFLEDKVKVRYYLTKGYGEPDVDEEIEFFYDGIKNLPKLTEFRGLGTVKREDVFIPGCNRTITFIFDSFQENSMGPLEEIMHGPYLKS